MPLLLFAFSIGVFGVGLFAELPPLFLLVIVAPAAVFCLFTRHAKAVFFLYAGVCWGTGYGWSLIDHQLVAKQELQEIVVRGTVTGLPVRDELRQRFELMVDSASLAEDGTQIPLHRLQLSWYQDAPDVLPGQSWQLRVSLRTPRGFANPGGFDYRLWLLRRGISATGYVRPGTDNRLLAAQWRWPDTVRYRLRLAIDDAPMGDRAKVLLKALIIADSTAMTSSDWQLLNQTGTTHLLVISGLHVGFFALVCYWLGAGLGRLTTFWWPQLPACHIAALSALAGAFFYTNLAGFGLPASRALVMAAVVLATRCLRTTISPFSGVGVALAAIAVVDPLAIHAGGFWLSFGAVFALLWVFGYRRGSLPGWQKLWWPQWAVFAALPGLLLLFFGRFSLLAPVTNILAIPWVSFSIVPASLIGVVLLPLSLNLANSCWQFAAWQLDNLWFLLVWLQKWPPPLQVSAKLPSSSVLLISVSIFSLLLLLPRGLPARWVGCIPLLVVLLAEPRRAPLMVSVLDVGQGLATVVQTRQHTLVYDTGASFGRRFDAGSGIIAPYLRAIGIARVDRVLVSHRDGDHVGGLPGLLASIAVNDVMSGEPLPGMADHHDCQAGMRWRWDDVDFEILSPASANAWQRNNRSCVLLVSFGKHRVLLPGDIESDIERWLATEQYLPNGVDILLAPHHGSKTSSSPTFAWQLAPRHVVYSAGYRHPFGHPHSNVVSRYQQIGSQQWNTASHGALEFVLREGQWTVSGYRQRRFYWQ